MAPEYQDHLAASVLNEGLVVNYRMLSRALKIHSNNAKEMLYDFHRTQNARKAGSVHATYLLTGTRRPATSSQGNGTSNTNGTDSFTSDAMLSSSMPGHEEDEEGGGVEHIPVTSISVVAEEHLEALKALYDRLDSIHVYSIEPGPLTNIQILAECNRKVAADYAKEDPLTAWRQYGVIQNPNTKRRTTKIPPPAPSQAAPSTAAMKAAKPSTTAAVKPSAREPERPRSRQGSEAAKTEPKKPASARRETSSLFKSFANSKAPAAKKAESSSDRSAAASPAPEDEPMADEDDAPLDLNNTPAEETAEETAESRAKADAFRAKRQKAEADMRAMMDASDDEQDADALPGIEDDEGAKDQEGDTAMTTEAEEAADDTGALDVPSKLEEKEQDTTVTGGRRRGRRRVMKKKTTKDAEGYLVTKEEAVWESFSEDEEPPAAGKAAVSAPPPATRKSGGGKAAKAGQGNIMSFFGKK